MDWKILNDNPVVHKVQLTRYKGSTTSRNEQFL
jgi:hypothetical protein